VNGYLNFSAFICVHVEPKFFASGVLQKQEISKFRIIRYFLEFFSSVVTSDGDNINAHNNSTRIEFSKKYGYALQTHDVFVKNGFGPGSCPFFVSVYHKKIERNRKKIENLSDRFAAIRSNFQPGHEIRKQFDHSRTSRTGFLACGIAVYPYRNEQVEIDLFSDPAVTYPSARPGSFFNAQCTAVGGDFQVEHNICHYNLCVRNRGCLFLRTGGSFSFSPFTQTTDGVPDVKGIVLGGTDDFATKTGRVKIKTLVVPAENEEGITVLEVIVDYN
jgi:hypothetical protein